MKFKMFSLISFLLLISFSTVASTSNQIDSEYKNIEEMMGAIRLEKKQVESMLDKMVVSGRISSEEGVKAKRELASLKESDLEDLKSRALVEVRSKRLVDH